MTKKAVLINDISGLGRCSLTASIPVLSVMGIQPCPMPTAVLSNQTGYESFYCLDCTGNLDHYTEEWQKLNLKPDGIFSGFLSSERQVDKIINFIDCFKRENPIVIVDPVMGDNGNKYDLFTDKLAMKMKELVSKADVITPNLTECCILCDYDYHKIMGLDGKEFFAELERLGKILIEKFPIKTAVVTGIVKNNCFYNMIVMDNTCDFIDSPVIGESYSGTGDLFAAVVFGHLLKGNDIHYAVFSAVRFLEASLRDTVGIVKDRNDGIEFEKHLSMLL